ncbi:MAG: hypothetical protein H6766_03390 [Candidatus Peribacteria bacterium]|nr:MAG: hypothetical protein H6766_03390 [Candidatus Peribacteria bacterium]
MSVIETNPAEVGTRTCRHCSSSFDIMQEDLDFYAKVSPKFGDYVAEIPTPTLCPDCRQRRRLAFRNERKLYTRTCDASKKPIISMYSPDKPYKVYDQKIWRSDARDPMDYGRDFDFSRTFTEQFGELIKDTPFPSLYNYFGENSDYCNCCNYERSCYLTSSASQNQNSLYSAYIIDCKNTVDSYMVFRCENSYGLVDCYDSYGLLYCSNTRNSSSSWFLTNCTNCQSCYNCDGLDNAKYCFDNQQYSQEEYQKLLDNVNHLETFSRWKNRKQQNTNFFSTNVDGLHIDNSTRVQK